MNYKKMWRRLYPNAQPATPAPLFLQGHYCGGRQPDILQARYGDGIFWQCFIPGCHSCGGAYPVSTPWSYFDATEQLTLFGPEATP